MPSALREAPVSLRGGRPFPRRRPAAGPLTCCGPTGRPEQRRTGRGAPSESVAVPGPAGGAGRKPLCGLRNRYLRVSSSDPGATGRLGPPSSGRPSAATLRPRGAGGTCPRASGRREPSANLPAREKELAQCCGLTVLRVEQELSYLSLSSFLLSGSRPS